MSTPGHGNGAPPLFDEAALKELQRQELAILLDVQAACNELGIEFFLGEGTLLGAVRHQGFIPWDDDVDLLMKRSEYDRFLRLAPPLLAPKYKVQHSTTVANYWSPVMKVRLVEGDEATDALISAANASGEALFTRTVLDGRVACRVSIGARSTELAHVRAAWGLLQRLAG